MVSLYVKWGNGYLTGLGRVIDRIRFSYCWTQNAFPFLIKLAVHQEGVWRVKWQHQPTSPIVHRERAAKSAQQRGIITTIICWVFMHVPQALQWTLNSLRHHLIPHHFYSSEKSELSELMQSDQYVGKAPVLIPMEVPRREGCNYPGWPQTSSLSFYAKAPAWWICELQVSVAGVQGRNGAGGDVPKRVFSA